MKLDVEVHHHFHHNMGDSDCDLRHIIRRELDVVLRALQLQGVKIMAKEDEAIAQIGAIKEKLAKVGGEIRANLAKIQELLEAAGNVPAGVTEGLTELGGIADQLDAENPDAEPIVP